MNFCFLFGILFFLSFCGAEARRRSRSGISKEDFQQAPREFQLPQIMQELERLMEEQRQHQRQHPKKLILNLLF